jgi:hypothetical protein
MLSRLDERHRHLAPFGIGPAHHRAALDGWMAADQVLDLDREHRHPLDLEHLLTTAEEVEVAALVDEADVAGVEPPLLDVLGGLVRGVPVPLHQRRGADHDLALFADRLQLVCVEVDDFEPGARNRQAHEHRL